VWPVSPHTSYLAHARHGNRGSMFLQILGKHLPNCLLSSVIRPEYEESHCRSWQVM
jgi:hypothetical protein